MSVFIPYADPDPAMARVCDIAASLAHFTALDYSRPAYIDYQGTFTYGELNTLARRTATWLRYKGVGAGETVAMPLNADAANARLGLIVLHALAQVGAIVLPLFPEVPLATRLDLIERLGAHWVLGAETDQVPGTVRVLDFARFNANDPALESKARPSAAEPDAPFIYRFTSGTTGVPKIVLATHAQFQANMRAGALSIGMDRDDRQLSVVPWPSGMGMRQLFHSLATGGAFVAAPLGESRAQLALTLGRFGVTRACASPLQVRRLLASPPAPLPPLRSLLVFGDFLAEEEAQAARAALTPEIYTGYGCNEVGALTRFAPGEAIEPGCVGWLLPGVQARADDGSGGAAKPGATGELAYRTPWMSQAYVGNEAATRERFRDGWFYPGDIGSIEADGRVFLRGRAHEAVNYGGLKIWPDDVEAVLRRHPGVSDCALVGLPDAQAGQLPVAFVVAGRESAGVSDAPGTAGAANPVWLGTQWWANWGDPWRGQPGVPLSVRAAPEDTLLQALRLHCERYMDATRVPVRFMLVERIPRNEAGKILREILAAGASG